jgi:hypothetical protein
MRFVAVFPVGVLLAAVLTGGYGTADDRGNLTLEWQGASATMAHAARRWPPLDASLLEDLVLEPLVIAPLDLDAAAALTGPVHGSLEEALLLEEPWTVRGQLEARQRHYFKLVIDGPPQLWHIEATGARLEYLVTGGRTQLQRSPASDSHKASLTSLLLLPGEHGFAVYSASTIDYTFRAVPLGAPGPHVEIEPNDELATAQLLELGGPLTGHLYDVGDQDFYRFSIAAEENLAFELQAPEDMTLRMQLLEVYGGGLTRTLHRSEGGGDIRHEAPLPPGDYLVQVYAQTANQRSDHPYVLQVRRLNPFHSVYSVLSPAEVAPGAPFEVGWQGPNNS